MLADCSDTSDDDEVQNFRPIRNKAVSYKEVFTSSEEDKPDIVNWNSKIKPQHSGCGSTTFKTNKDVVNDVGLGHFSSFVSKERERKGRAKNSSEFAKARAVMKGDWK